MVAAAAILLARAGAHVLVVDRDLTLASVQWPSSLLKTTMSLFLRRNPFRTCVAMVENPVSRWGRLTASITMLRIGGGELWSKERRR